MENVFLKNPELAKEAVQSRESLVRSVVKAFVPDNVISNIVDRQKKPIYTDEEMQFLSDGVLLRSADRVSYSDLRRASYSTSIIGAIHKIRIDDMSRFSNIVISKNKKSEGFGFQMEDEEKETTSKDKELIKNACKFFQLMGDRTEGWSKRDKLGVVFEMMIRDTLSIDGTAFFLVKNQLGRLKEVRYLDPATINAVDSGKGYRGDKRVGYVQIVNNNVKEVFEHDEIILRNQYHLSDVRMRGFGLSPTETCIMELVAMLNLLKYNRDRFNSRNPPPGMITLQGDISQEVLEELQMQYASLYSGNNNNYRIPIIAAPGDVKYMPLSGIPDDMTFDKLFQTVSSLVLAAHGMDSAELGIRLQDSQSLSEANPDGKINNSMTRSKKAMLNYFSDIFNEIKEYIPEYDDIKQVFYGISFDDDEAEIARNDKAIRTYMTIDEIRAKNDLEPLGEVFSKSYGVDLELVKRLGGTILDGTYSMYSQNILASLDGGDDQEEGEDDEGESGAGENDEGTEEEDNEETGGEK